MMHLDFTSKGTYSFLLGAFLSAALVILLEDVAQRQVGLFLTLFGLFILFSFYILESLRSSLDKKVEQLGLTVLWTHSADETYARAEEIIRLAEKRILALSAYAPNEPVLSLPAERSHYLAAIEGRLEKHLHHVGQSKFYYRRVLQTERAGDLDGVISPNVFNEEPAQTFGHCQRVLNLMGEDTSGRLDIDIQVSEPVQSLPGMILVDDRFVILFLFNPVRKLGHSSQALEFMGGIVIDDRTGGIISDFERVLNKVSQESRNIRTIRANTPGLV